MVYDGAQFEELSSRGMWLHGFLLSAAGTAILLSGIAHYGNGFTNGVTKLHQVGTELHRTCMAPWAPS